MKKLLLIALLIGIGSTAFSQTKNWRASFFNKNELSLALFTQAKFYPEVRLQSDEDFSDKEVSFFLRNDLAIDIASNTHLSWGLGASMISDDFGYLRLPLYLCRENILSENVGLMLGVEFKSDLEDSTKLLPKIGVSISF